MLLLNPSCPQNGRCIAEKLAREFAGNVPFLVGLTEVREVLFLWASWCWQFFVWQPRGMAVSTTGGGKEGGRRR